MRVPIAFEWWYRIVSWCVLLPPSQAFVTVDDDQVTVTMGWAFRATFPRTAIAAAAEDHRRPISRGAHGWGGRWLVNGAGRPLVSIDLDPVQRARVLGMPVALRRVTVSVADPDALLGALR